LAIALGEVEPPRPIAVAAAASASGPAATPDGPAASWAVACEAPADFRTTVAIIQDVFGPVATVAAGVSPVPTTRSSASNSMSPTLETLTRWVKPAPEASASSKPESV
jgi:hypothetical protein